MFPHAGVHDCGYQIAACVHAALDSGADKVVVLSVLHAFTPAMEEARVAVAAGEDPARFAFWGIQGPGIDGRSEWQSDHALISWRHFWNAELKRRGIREGKAPQVHERYPYLAGGKPESLPGIDELARLMEEAAVVSTADPFHHGIGYGDAPEDTYDHDETGLAHARSVIEAGIGNSGARRLPGVQSALRRVQERRARYGAGLSISARADDRRGFGYQLYRCVGVIRSTQANLGGRRLDRLDADGLNKLIQLSSP